MRIIILMMAALIMLPFATISTGAHSLAPPEIIKVNRSWDVTEGGAKIVITGKNFVAGTIVVLGDTEITKFAIRTSNKLVFRVPGQKTPGARTLTIINSAGIAQQQFDIISKPLSQTDGVDITTVAGGIAYVGDGEQINNPLVSVSISRIAIDRSGNIFIADTDNNRVRRLDAASGVITTVAGYGVSQFSGDNGPALCAGLEPFALTVDKAGNLFIGDQINHCVRRVDAQSGIITTVAGNGRLGSRGDGGPATMAELCSPISMAVDSKGNLLIADIEFGVVRRVDAQSGIISLYAGNSMPFYNGDHIPAKEASIQPFDIILDDSDNLFVCDVGSNRVRRIDGQTGIITTVAGNGSFGFSGDGGPAIEASLLPASIAFDNKGNLLVSDTTFYNVRRIDKVTGIIATIVGDGDANYSGDGSLATATGIDPVYIFEDGGDLLIIDNDSLRRVAADTQIVSTIARRAKAPIGDGSLATNATLSSPASVARDNAGNLFILDIGNNCVRRVDAVSGKISTFAGGGADDNYFGDLVATDALLYFPTSIAVDSIGNLYISEDSYIRKVDAARGVISLLAGTRTHGFFGDDSPANLAIFAQHITIAIDFQDNIFVADQNNFRVRKIDMVSNIITTVAGNGVIGFSGDNGLATKAQLNLPSAVTVDNNGNIFIADTANFRVRRVDAASGNIATVVGTGLPDFSGDNDLATNAAISDIGNIVVDREGNLFIADFGNERVRRIDGRTGIIITIAGNGESGYSGDDDLAINANLFNPIFVAIDNDGNLFIADNGNNSVRAVKGVAASK
jgi:sugar lactone lactonase YvrE